jgi:tRNA dimethylallyltransferase
MKIGTAVPSDKQLAAVKHHLIGHRSIHDDYNASVYEGEALQVLDRLFQRFDRVIMTGGSGMYIDAVCHGIDDIPTVDPTVREKLRVAFEAHGIGYLRDALQKTDPDYFLRVDQNNPKRMLKALEVSETSGKPYSSFLTGRLKSRNFHILQAGLDLPRSELHDRINRRVEEMMQAGLVEEARELLPHRGVNALNTVGYKEMFGFFDGSCSVEEAVEQIKGHTRQYARRQLTWFRKSGMVWFEPSQIETMLNWIRLNIENRDNEQS